MLRFELAEKCSFKNQFLSFKNSLNEIFNTSNPGVRFSHIHKSTVLLKRRRIHENVKKQSFKILGLGTWSNTKMCS